jgi:RNA polymerase sigma-70 factor, ECF subfamily
LVSAEHLVDAHLEALHGLAVAWTHDRDLAQELTHRTFLKAIERRAQLRDPGAARAWLITILRNELVSEFRRRRREVAWEVEHEEIPEPGPDGPWNPEALEALPAALDCLPEAARTILLLRFQQELRYEDIAAVLQIPLGTVMSRLHRAKAALRTHLTAMASVSGAP